MSHRYIDTARDGSGIVRLWEDGLLLGILRPFTPDVETLNHATTLDYSDYNDWRQLTGQTYAHKDTDGLTFWKVGA